MLPKFLSRLFIILLTVTLVDCDDPETISPAYYSCFPSFADVSESHPDQSKYQQALNWYAGKGFPGAVLLIKDGVYGPWIAASGKADIANNIPFEKCTKSRIASITKMFVATTVLMLEEEGVLSIDDPVNKWVSHNITDHVENANESTILQLLNHTSGIFNYTNNLQMITTFLNDPEQHLSLKEKIKYVYKEDAYFPPGKGFEYSNTNYLLLGLIIEAATQKSVSAVIREHIIDKLNLQHTYFDSIAVPPGTARGYYDLNDNGKLVETTHYNGLHYDSPDGCMVSNVYDLAIFIESLFNGQLVSEASLARMKEGVAAEGSTWYGLGMRIYSTSYGIAYGHSGADFGYQSQLMYFPATKTTVALLVNGGGGQLDDAKGNWVNSLPERIFKK